LNKGAARNRGELVLLNGIPAKDIGYKILNCSKPGELMLAIEGFLDGAKAENLSILDISFITRKDELLAVFFFKQPH
jgi:hypothetical protein